MEKSSFPSWNRFYVALVCSANACKCLSPIRGKHIGLEKLQQIQILQGYESFFGSNLYTRPLEPCKDLDLLVIKDKWIAARIQLFTFFDYGPAKLILLEDRYPVFFISEKAFCRQGY